jgi:hypothetical protein
MAKMRRRADRYHQALAICVTMFEALLTLTFVRLIYRLVMKAFYAISGKKAKVAAL